jgi:hypothetical protein
MVCRRGSHRVESVRPLPIVGTSRHSLFCHTAIIPRRIGARLRQCAGMSPERGP